MVRAGTPFLDEADHVYLPLMGPARTCLRLNRYASRLWRRWLQEPIDERALGLHDRRFLNELLGQGALTLVTSDR